MTDEIHSENSNEEKSSFQHLNPAAENILETNEKRLSKEDIYIQPIENGNGNHQEDSLNIQSTENHQEDSSNIQSTENHQEDSLNIQSTENHHSHSIQETTPVHNSDQEINDSDSSQNNQDSSQIFDTTDHENNSNNDQSFQINQDSSQIFDTTDHENNSNTDQSFPIETYLQDKPEEIRSQRDLDDNEIPPAELSEVDQSSISDTTTTNSSSENEKHSINDRPLTELETPYEHHHDENENSSVQSPSDEINFNDNRPLTQLETPDDNQSSSFESPTVEQSPDVSHQSIEGENEGHPITLAAFLPDLVNETIEQNQGDAILQPNQSENGLNEENNLNYTDENFPPLPQAEDALKLIYNEKDFPPLSSVSTTNEETLTKESLIASNNQTTPPVIEDVLGNKTLLKQILVKGTENTRPTRSTMVTISYTLSVVDNITSNVRVIEVVQNEKYFVSECDLIPAIDICLQTMNRGEHSLIDSDIRHCYGDIGCEEKQVPPISSTHSYRMKIDLELHDWISPTDVQILSIEERLIWGDKKRQMGNFYYRRQDYKTALQCYHGALRFLDTDNNPLSVSFDQTQRSILNDRYIQVQNNVAQVNLLLNKYDACLNAVENVLKHDPKNVKALFRQGKALYELGKYEQALQPLKSFIQIQKSNSSITVDYDKANEMISISENKLANYEKSEKEIYRRMFQPSPPTTTTTTTTNSTAVNQQRSTINKKQIDNQTNNWWPYIALGSAVLAVIGFVTFTKYRKVS